MEDGMVTAVPKRPRSPWSWKNSTTLEKYLLCAIGLMIIILTIVTAVAKVQSLQAATSNHNDGKTTAAICNTMPCLKAAYSLMNRMNLTIDPCVNFHQYACGGRLQQHSDDSTVVAEVDTSMSTTKTLMKIMESESSKDDLRAFNMTRTYYQNCMRKYEYEQGFNAVKTVINEIGIIYDNDIEWKKARINLTTLLYNLIIRKGALFFEIGSTFKNRNSHQKTIEITFHTAMSFALRSLTEGYDLWKSSSPDQVHFRFQPDGTFNDDTQNQTLNEMSNVTTDGSLFLQQMKEPSIRKRNEKLLTTLREYFGRSANDSQQQRLEDEVVTFLSNLTKLLPSEKVLSQANFNEETDQKYSIRELNKLFTHVDWKSLLQLLFDRPFSDDDVVSVHYPPYFKALQQLISNTNLRIVHNAALAFYANINLWPLIRYNETGRSNYCIGVVSGIFSIPLSAMYLQSFPPHFLKQLKDNMEDLFNNLKRSFQNIIDKNKWLDDSSKEKLLLKLSNIKTTIVGSDLLHNAAVIEKSVENITVTGDNFIVDTLSEAKRMNLEFYRMNANVEDFGLHIVPYMSNAFNYYTRNWITMPLAFLLPPFYDGEQPKYMTYGKAASVLAHEIAHAYGPEGIHLDEFGEQRQWLTKKTLNEFKERARCFIETYSKQKQTLTFMGQTGVLHVDGILTLEETMADSVGDPMAYQAYKDWTRRHEEEPALPGLNLSADQIFFLARTQLFCDEHSTEDYIYTLETSSYPPNPHRVNGLSMNSELFAEAFQCPIGSPMNPVTKCHMW